MTAPSQATTRGTNTPASEAKQAAAMAAVATQLHLELLNDYELRDQEAEKLQRLATRAWAAAALAVAYAQKARSYQLGQAEWLTCLRYATNAASEARAALLRLKTQAWSLELENEADSYCGDN